MHYFQSTLHVLGMVSFIFATVGLPGRWMELGLLCWCTSTIPL